MLYDVEIREVSSRVVQVEANSVCEAEEKAEELWNAEEYVLDATDFDSAYFEVIE